MKLPKPILAAVAGLLVFAACTKKDYEPDEKGYEKFQKDRTAPPIAFTLTLPDGKVNYRLPFTEWFASGQRFITFVVREEDDADNYRIWAISRTVRTAETFNIAFRLDRNPILPL